MREGNWYIFNDSSVTLIDREELMYVLDNGVDKADFYPYIYIYDRIEED